MSFVLYICLSIFMPVFLFACSSVCQTVYLSFSLLVHPFACLSLYTVCSLFECMSICPIMRPAVCQSIYLSACLSVCLFVCLPVCLFVCLCILPGKVCKGTMEESVQISQIQILLHLLYISKLLTLFYFTTIQIQIAYRNKWESPERTRYTACGPNLTWAYSQSTGSTCAHYTRCKNKEDFIDINYKQAKDV